MFPNSARPQYNVMYFTFLLSKCVIYKSTTNAFDILERAFFLIKEQLVPCRKLFSTFVLLIIS